jgi:hypothetical protein
MIRVRVPQCVLPLTTDGESAVVRDVLLRRCHPAGLVCVARTLALRADCLTVVETLFQKSEIKLHVPWLVHTILNVCTTLPKCGGLR